MEELHSDKSIYKKFFYISISLLIVGIIVLSIFLWFGTQEISFSLGYIFSHAPGLGLFLFLFIVVFFFGIGIASLTIYIIKPGGVEKREFRRLQEKQAKFTGKYPSQQPTPKSVGFSVQKGISKKENLLIFMSYATKDAELFKISDIANKLTNYNEINDVLYWQEDAGKSIVEYMEENLNKCDLLLLFCSPNSLHSSAVKKEYEAAQFMGKIIIPVFTEISHVPTLLQPERGVRFDMFDLHKTIEEIYKLIKKKI
ncbi:MAG: toll/interleukin-1 receptor domain-containing protein [Promethearchaeota archaeon]